MSIRRPTQVAFKLIIRSSIVFGLIFVTYVGKFIIMGAEQAVNQISNWRMMDTSLDILFAAFAIVLGSMIFDKEKKSTAVQYLGYYIGAAVVIFAVILLLKGVLPGGGFYAADDTLLTFLIPNGAALVMLGWAVMVPK